MPNQPVCCPQCGSPSCHEYRADSFVCQHCDGTFRWVNPSRFTVLHRSAHCACGKRSIGCCTQCEEPLCRQHLANWKAVLGSWQQLKFAYAAHDLRWHSAVKQQGGMSSCRLERPPGWLSTEGTAPHLNDIALGKRFAWVLPAEITQAALPHIGLTSVRKEDLLCLSCVETLFLKLLHPIEATIARLAACGRLCQLCSEERETDTRPSLALAFPASGHCHDCGIPVCGAHFHVCGNCQTLWCKPHHPDRHASRCRHCRPLARLARLFK